MKVNEIREMNAEELNQKLASLKEELFNLRFQLATGLCFIIFLHNELRLDRELVTSETHSFHCDLLGNAVHLEEDAARLNNSYPVLRRTFTGTHAGLGRFSRYRLIRENLDPDLAAALDVTRHGDTSCLDLTVRDPSRLEGYEAILAMANRIAAMSLALHTATELLAILSTLWN